MNSNSGARSGTPKPHQEKSFRLGSRMFAGFLLAILLLLGAGGWATTAQLTGAVIAQGSVKVDQNLKSVQHRDGGIVSEIAVKAGDSVQAGQVLLRLDDAQTRAELSIIRSQLIELAARKARLVAERDALDAIEFPHGLDVSSQQIHLIIKGERRLFEGKRAHRDSQRNQFELQIDQIGEEIRGLEAQRNSKEREISLVEVEFSKLKGLLDKGLVEGSRVYSVDRDRSRLLGERGEIGAAIARAKTRISEIRVQIFALDEAARTEAQRELSGVEAKISELIERRVAMEDRLSRTDIRAPISGTVNEVNIHTIGGVIRPAEVLVTIVPESARLMVEAQLSPVTIDQIAVGTNARLRFSAFNQRTTPELKGELVYVSPATSRDSTNGQTYYVGHVQVSAEELQKLGTERLIPGMPVEVFVSTEERTAMSYFVKPITDQFSRAFRER